MSVLKVILEVQGPYLQNPKLGHSVWQTQVYLQGQRTDYLNWWCPRKEGFMAVVLRDHPVQSPSFHSEGNCNPKRLSDLPEVRRQKCLLFSQLWRLSQQGVGGRNKEGAVVAGSLPSSGLIWLHSACFNPEWVWLSPTHQRNNIRSQINLGVLSSSRPRQLGRKGSGKLKVLFLQGVAFCGKEMLFSGVPFVFSSQKQDVKMTRYKLITPLAF